MTSISRTKQNELLLLNGSRNDFLFSGLITAIIVSVPVAVFLAFTYLVPGALISFLITIFVLFFLTLSVGFFLRLEYRLISTSRLTTTLPFFTTTGFVVWAAIFFILYLGNPESLGFRTIIAAFFVFPLLLTFAVAFLYSIIVHRLFFRHLARRVSCDFIALYYQDELQEKLTAAWESVKRYSGRLSLMLISFSYTHTSNPQKGALDTEAIAYLDKLYDFLRKRIRATDETGIRSQDKLWLILYRTSFEEAQIPKNRLLKDFETSPDLAELRERNGLVVKSFSLVEMTDDMKEPCELAEKAEQELGKA